MPKITSFRQARIMYGTKKFWSTKYDLWCDVMYDLPRIGSSGHWIFWARASRYDWGRWAWGSLHNLEAREVQ